MLYLGERLKNLREQKGLRQSQLAERLGVSRALISGYETGTKLPSIDMIIKLSYSFHVTTDYLLGLTREQNIDKTGLTENQLQIIFNLISEFKDCNMHVQ
jgi:transcriptional regulator with XRE-family HTH domain